MIQSVTCALPAAAVENFDPVPTTNHALRFPVVSEMHQIHHDHVKQGLDDLIERLSLDAPVMPGERILVELLYMKMVCGCQHHMRISCSQPQMETVEVGNAHAIGLSFRPPPPAEYQQVRDLLSSIVSGVSFDLCRPATEAASEAVYQVQRNAATDLAFVVSQLPQHSVHVVLACHAVMRECKTDATAAVQELQQNVAHCAQLHNVVSESIGLLIDRYQAIPSYTDDKHRENRLFVLRVSRAPWLLATPIDKR